jgi:ferredoxin
MSFINVSVGIKGDPHVRKFAIDHTLCSDCKECVKVCPQEAIGYRFNNLFNCPLDVSDHKCIGCGKCHEVCKSNALIAHYSTRKFSEIIPPLVEMGIDSIEYHAVSPKTDEVIQGWNELQSLFPGGMLSYCIDRKHSGDLDFVDRISKALKGREDWSTIIQADGNPMSGCDNDESTTLQALASAQLFDRMNAKAYLLLSGGTNARTGWLARMMGINYHGVSVGSYARHLVQKYFKEHLDLRYEDLYNQREIFDEVVNKVRPLVASI